MRITRGLATVALALSVAWTVAGCGAIDEGKPVAPLAPGNSAPAPEGANDATGGQLGGKAVELASGLVISVSAPARYKPSEYAAMNIPRTKASKFFVVTVKIENRGTEPLDVQAYWSGTSGAEGDALDQVFDTGKIGDQPTTAVRVGKRQTFKLAFHQPTGDLSEITLDGMMLGGLATATFTGKL